MTRSIVIPGLLGVLLCASTPKASGATIYSNFGPGNTFSTSGFVLEGPSVHNIADIDQAGSATTGSTSYLLTQISVGIQVTGPLPFDGRGPLLIGLASDNSGVPGTLLTSGVANLTSFGVQVASVSPTPITLAANTTYWVVLEPETTFDGAFEQNSTGDMSASAGRSNGGAWALHSGAPNFALELDGRAITNTPEPASWEFFSFAAVALTVTKRKRRRAGSLCK